MSIKLTIHIGQHKTGSKALQAFLTHNRANLLRNHIYFPECINNSTQKAYRISHFEFFVLLKYACLKELGQYSKAKAFIKQHRCLKPFPSLHQYLSNIFANASQLGANQIILSCEDLFDMSTAHEIEYDSKLLEMAVRIIDSICTPLAFKLEVIALLRDPYDLANAHYAQFIKGSKHYLNFDQFFDQFHPRLDAKHIVNIWRNGIPNARIVLIPYEGELHKKVQHYFISNVLRLEQLDFFSYPGTDAEFSNITPSTPYINLIREMNERLSKGLSYIPREAILKYAFEYPLISATNWLSQKQREFIRSHYDNDFDDLARNYLAKPKFFSASANEPRISMKKEEWQKIRSSLEQAMIYPSRNFRIKKLLNVLKSFFSM